MSSIASLALLTLALPGGPGEPPKRPLASMFPAETYAVVQFAGLRACSSAVQDVGLIRLADMVHERLEGRSLHSEILREMVPEIDRELRHIGLDRATLHQVLQGRMALGVSRPTFFDNEILPSVVLAIDVEGHEAAANNIVARFADMLQQEGPEIQRSRTESSGFTITTLSPRRHNGALSFATGNGMLLLSNSPGYVADCIENWNNGGSGSLFESEAFQRSMKRAGEGSLASLFVNAELLKFASAFMPYETDGIIDAVGLKGLRGMFLDLSTQAGGSRDAFFVDVERAEGGMAHGLMGGKLSGRAARYCPSNTLLFATESFDHSTVINAFDRLVQSLPNEVRDEFEDEVYGELAGEMNRAGISLDEMMKALAAVGPEWTMALPMPKMAMGMPSLEHPVMFADVNSQAGLGAKLADLLGEFGQEVRSTSFQDHEIRYCRIPLGESVPGVGSSLSPSFVEVDGMMLVSTDVRALKAALRRSQGDDNLAATADYRSLVERHGYASKILQLRLSENLGAIYAGLKPQAENWLDANGEEIGMTSEDLPTLEDLQGMLGDVLITCGLSEEGFELRNESMIGFGAALAVVGNIADLALGADGAGRPRRKVD